MAACVRSCWQNCSGLDDKSLLSDKELLSIDAIEDSIAPLSESTKRIRELITRFEACYHEADKEALRIIEAIGAERCARQSNARPPKRKRELQNSHSILSLWCNNSEIKGIRLKVGGVSAKQLLGFIGEPNPLKVWQVQRIVERTGETLDPNQPYHRMALDLGDYGEPGAYSAGDYYKADAAFLKQTQEAIIHDTEDGRQAKISLAMAIDLLMPCHWDFVGALSVILKAIGGELHPKRPYACCSRNIKLSPLCDELKAISDTLGAFWQDNTKGKTNRNIPALLGQATSAKRWLTASMDKTIRLQLKGSGDFWLTFS